MQGSQAKQHFRLGLHSKSLPDHIVAALLKESEAAQNSCFPASPSEKALPTSWQPLRECCGAAPLGSPGGLLVVADHPGPRQKEGLPLCCKASGNLALLVGKKALHLGLSHSHLDIQVLKGCWIPSQQLHGVFGKEADSEEASHSLVVCPLHHLWRSRRELPCNPWHREACIWQKWSLRGRPGWELARLF